VGADQRLVLQVMNVELLLSALEACGVDNARIEIEGGHEIPVLDNSALGWCIEVQVRGCGTVCSQSVGQRTAAGL
jgi:UDP-3-O-acyl-N-acetylglucosamine deacetylase